MKEVLFEAEGSVLGSAGKLSLIYEPEMLILSWTCGGQEDQYMLSDDTIVSTEGIDDKLALIIDDGSGEEVFRCDLIGDNRKFADNLEKTKEELFNQAPVPGEPSRDTLESRTNPASMSGLLEYLVSNRASQKARTLNSLVTCEKLDVLLQDNECIRSLAAHLPDTLQNHPDHATLLKKILRSSAFRRSGEELTEALFDGQSLFRTLEIEPTPQALADPISALVGKFSQ